MDTSECKKTTTASNLLNFIEAKSMSAFENGRNQHWEATLIDCCDSCTTCLQACCFPCLAAGEAALSIGVKGELVGLFMLLLYICGIVLAVVFGQQQEFKLYTETHYSYGHLCTYKFETFEPNYGLLVGALVYAFVYGLVVCKVRNMVRHFYHIPGSWAEDLFAAFFVTCCVIAQMKRHTKLADVKKKKAEEGATTLPAYSKA